MFTNLINKTRKVARTSKHQASKKGYKHIHNLSKGQLKDYHKKLDKNQKWFE